MKKIIAHIPARKGSKRVIHKNMRDLSGHPLVYYSIRTAQKTKMLSEYWINTDCMRIAQYAEELGVSVHHRPQHLCQDDITQDHFNYDFLLAHQCDILVLINPVCPFINETILDQAIENFIQQKFQTMIGVTSYHLHALKGDIPINFDKDKALPKTQDIDPVKVINWGINIWDAEYFKRHYEEKGHANLIGRIGHFELTFPYNLKISTEDDFILAEKMHHLLTKT
jgi:CMP-N-acetylneuraminic acid synthetase